MVIEASDGGGHPLIQPSRDQQLDGHTHTVPVPTFLSHQTGRQTSMLSMETTCLHHHSIERAHERTSSTVVSHLCPRFNLSPPLRVVSAIGPSSKPAQPFLEAGEDAAMHLHKVVGCQRTPEGRSLSLLLPGRNLRQTVLWDQSVCTAEQQP